MLLSRQVVAVCSRPLLWHMPWQPQHHLVAAGSTQWPAPPPLRQATTAPLWLSAAPPTMGPQTLLLLQQVRKAASCMQLLQWGRLMRAAGCAQSLSVFVLFISTTQL